ncbi:MAG: hypothetical protein HY864_07945 [Chloroflexi bacterium]|nr:hypothetical protein [Chloroflexota bacterium]
MYIEPDWDKVLFNARVAITDNPNFNAWYGTLPPHVRQLLDDVLDHDVTPDMILAAQESIEEEWEYTFVQAIGNGNPSPTVANDLTDVVLELVTWEFTSDE